jgi:hypothetical protein
MKDDHPSTMPGRRAIQTAPASPAEGCPAWCEGKHEVDDLDAEFHVRVVAQRGRASVALSCLRHHEPAETGSTVIIMATEADVTPIELAESDAIRLVGTLEAAAGGTSWQSAALRSALDLLDPGVGWPRPVSRPEV